MSIREFILAPSTLAAHLFNPLQSLVALAAYLTPHVAAVAGTCGELLMRSRL